MRWLRFLGIGSAIVCGLALVLLALLLYQPGRLLGLPDVRAIQQRASAPSTLILDRHGNLLYEMIDPHAGYQRPLALEEIPPHLRQAVIATEDASFYSNPGVNLRAVARALWMNLREGRVVSGGSTITQQLARNLLLGPEERYAVTWQRKAREAVLAYHLTRVLSKDEILALYLNETYFGNMAYGVEAAARVYMNKPVGQLDLAECALLAGLPQSPIAYNPLTNLAAAKERQLVVLQLMAKSGYISSNQADLAYREPLQLASSPLPIEAPHLVMLVRQELEELVGKRAIERGGLQVYTTLDLDMQHSAETHVRNHLQTLNEPRKNEPSHNVHNAAVVVLDAQTAALRVMVGSPDYFDPSIDGAVNATVAWRQPGSAIKPFTYAAAFERGYTPATMITDVRTAFSTIEGRPYVPQNYDYRFHGPVLLRQALACSYNVVAVKLLDQIGAEVLADMARSAGITSLDRIERQGLSLTLGGMEVSLLELTGAYGAFARGGIKRQPYFIEQVIAPDGQTLFSAQEPPEVRIMDERVAYLITHILSDEHARLPAFGAGSALELPFPAAVKTGTTTEWRDNWTVGYSTAFVVGVWVGNADNEPMRRVSGISGAAPIWNAVMHSVHRQNPSPFARPAGIMEQEICAESGQLPGPACNHRKQELFLAEHLPTTSCSLHRLVVLDAATGEPAAADCPPERRVYRKVTYWPADAMAWAEQEGLPLPPKSLTPDGAALEDIAIAGPGRGGPRLLSPDPNSHYLIVPGLPAESQRIEIAAAVPYDVEVRELALWVNGQPEHTWTVPPYQLFWPLREGQYALQVRAITSLGQVLDSPSVHVFVSVDDSKGGRSP